MQENGELFQVESQKQNGVTIWETRHKLEFAIGFGENGITFAVRRGNQPSRYKRSDVTYLILRPAKI